MTFTYINLWKNLLRYQVFAYMNAMLLEKTERKDRAKTVYFSQCSLDTIVSMRIALQSYKEIDGIVA